ncbi:rho guanine nucleotide exchange factor 39 isoform X2 [Rana temporaria]|uniref:rho guanine nucleotide exchange factor 39 isoform X2 n=1 Tax=Rana temporaria TaxID=8407 RepID=UPI001AADD6FA|nr:rho guanine nucleotide exchange factor 39 isoform X2 [Rana temporaria]
MEAGQTENMVEGQRQRWERKRSRTARDLLMTERQYVEQLELINKYYDEVFRARCGNLKIAQQGICGTIPSILQVHRSLLTSLERNSSGSGFEKFSQYLHLYKKHADCIDATRCTVQTQTKKKKSFARFKKLQESRPEFQGRTLEELLELPLHRLVRYRHYLTDLVGNNFPGSTESVQLNDALQAVSAACDYIEDAQQLQENEIHLQRVQKLLKGRRVRIATPGRRYIREGWLALVPPSGEELKHRMLFLFSDVLAITSPCHPLHPINAQKFCCRAVYPLRECRVERVLGHTQSQGGLISLSFKMEKLLLMSSDQQDMNSWYECLLSAVRKLRSEGSADSGGSQSHPTIPEEPPNTSGPPRGPKRRHVTVLREDSGDPEEATRKRMRVTDPVEEKKSEPQSQADNGAGWRCVVL